MTLPFPPSIPSSKPTLASKLRISTCPRGAPEIKAPPQTSSAAQLRKTIKVDALISTGA